MRLIILLTIFLSIASSGYSQRFADKISPHPDIDYVGANNPRQALDLYLPTEPSTSEPLPVICFIHGGAWRAGNKKAGRNHLAPYVSSGNYAGISIAYRLTDEAHWPAQIHDCKAAIRWIRANAKTYNLNPDKIAAWGTSAGGHLVAMLGTSGEIKDLEGELGPHRQHSSRVSAVVDFFGPSELLTMADHPSRMDHNAADSPESMLVGGALQKSKQAARAASPVSYVTPDDPPFLIVHGTADPLVPYPQSQTLHKLLGSAKVPTTLIPVDNGGHGNFRDPSINAAVAAFLTKHLIAATHPKQR